MRDNSILISITVSEIWGYCQNSLDDPRITSQFWAQKCKNQYFEENKGFDGSFFELKYRWFKTRLAELKTPTREILLMNDI